MPPFAFQGPYSEFRQSLIILAQPCKGQAMTAPPPGNPRVWQVLFFGKAEALDATWRRAKGGFIGSDLSSYKAWHAAADIRGCDYRTRRRKFDSRSGWYRWTTTEGGAKTFTGKLVRKNEDKLLPLRASIGRREKFSFCRQVGTLRKRIIRPNSDAERTTLQARPGIGDGNLGGAI